MAESAASGSRFGEQGATSCGYRTAKVSRNPAKRVCLVEQAVLAPQDALAHLPFAFGVPVWSYG